MDTDYKPLHRPEEGIRYTIDGFIEKRGKKLRRMTDEEHMDMATQLLLRSE